MSNGTLKREIMTLIKLKKEGEYWDFKKEWYGNDTKQKANMLHDIICMANNLQFRDAYIIIGVDEENDFEVVDVSSNEHRRNTQNLVDFLREVPFDGNHRPNVYVEPIWIKEAHIDVIVIEKSYNTPYFLKEQYKNNYSEQ